MRNREALANILVFAGPFLVSLVLAILVPLARGDGLTFVCLTICAWTIGFVLILLGKLSLLQRGVLSSFGSGQMLRWNNRAYRFGYALMLFGFLATVALAIASHSPR
jgi:hypothetical protein